MKKLCKYRNQKDCRSYPKECDTCKHNLIKENYYEPKNPYFSNKIKQENFCAICCKSIPKHSQQALEDSNYSKIYNYLTKTSNYFCPSHSPKEIADFIYLKTKERI